MVRSFRDGVYSSSLLRCFYCLTFPLKLEKTAASPAHAQTCAKDWTRGRKQRLVGYFFHALFQMSQTSIWVTDLFHKFDVVCSHHGLHLHSCIISLQFTQLCVGSMWTVCTAFLTLSEICFKPVNVKSWSIMTGILNPTNDKWMAWIVREGFLCCYLPLTIRSFIFSCVYRWRRWWLLLFMRCAAGCCLRIPADLHMPEPSCLSAQIYQRRKCFRDPVSFFFLPFPFLLSVWGAATGVKTSVAHQPVNPDRFCVRKDKTSQRKRAHRTLPLGWKC